MKYLVIISCFVCNVCFSYTIDMPFHTEKAKEIYKSKNYLEAISYLDELIDSEETLEVDKVHYLLLKINYLAINSEKEKLDKVLEELDNLCRTNYLCNLELKYSYNLDYLSN